MLLILKLLSKFLDRCDLGTNELIKNIRDVRYQDVLVNGAPDRIRICDPYHVKVIL